MKRAKKSGTAQAVGRSGRTCCSARLSLHDCRSMEDVCQLRRDNYGIGDYWMCCDGYDVTVCHQKLGEAAQESCTIPMREFNHLVRQYTKPQRLVRRRPNVHLSGGEAVRSK